MTTRNAVKKKASGSADTTTKRAKGAADSRILRGIHRDVKALHDVGIVTKKTMGQFDESCLPAVPKLTPEGIASLRKVLGVSQGVLSRYVNVTKDTLSKWEQDKKKPSGPALKLLDIARRRGLEALAGFVGCGTDHLVSPSHTEVAAPNLGFGGFGALNSGLIELWLDWMKQELDPRFREDDDAIWSE